MRKTLTVVAFLALGASGAQAAFVVEAHVSGKANGNWSGNMTGDSIPSAAVGLSATNSKFGGSGTDPLADPDWCQYAYTPGVDADNTPLAAGTYLGGQYLAPAGPPSFVIVNEEQVASGLEGGESGLYNVYITWVSTVGVNQTGMRVEVTHDGGTDVFDPVNQNNGGTGTPGANDAWLRLNNDPIRLSAGHTYTVRQTANSIAFVSMRAHGVMWERVPEPTTLALLGLGGLFLRRSCTERRPAVA